MNSKYYKEGIRAFWEKHIGKEPSSQELAERYWLVCTAHEEGIEAGAAIAFGLMGMAEAIRAGAWKRLQRDRLMVGDQVRFEVWPDDGDGTFILEGVITHAIEDLLTVQASTGQVLKLYTTDVIEYRR